MEENGCPTTRLEFLYLKTPNSKISHVNNLNLNHCSISHIVNRKSWVDNSKYIVFVTAYSYVMIQRLCSGWKCTVNGSLWKTSTHNSTMNNHRTFTFGSCLSCDRLYTTTDRGYKQVALLLQRDRARHL